MSVQYIEENGKTAFVVLPVADYEALMDKLEMIEDIDALDQAKEDGGEWMPADMVYRLLDGDNPIKVWREHRGLTQSQLAQRAGIAQATVGQLETGARTGSVAVLKKVADVLDVDLDDLV